MSDNDLINEIDPVEDFIEKAVDVNSYTQRLINLKMLFEQKELLAPGDIVTWKEGLKNKRMPDYNDLGIILKVIDPPIIDNEAMIGSPYYQEVLDIQVGFITNSKEFVCFPLDSKRFKKI